MSKKPELEVKEKSTIKCGDCDKFILDVITLKDGSDNLTKIKVYCKCGGSSYITPVIGTHRISPVEPLKLKNVVNKDNIEEVWIC